MESKKIWVIYDTRMDIKYTYQELSHCNWDTLLVTSSINGQFECSLCNFLNNETCTVLILNFQRLRL